MGASRAVHAGNIRAFQVDARHLPLQPRVDPTCLVDGPQAVQKNFLPLRGECREEPGDPEAGHFPANVDHVPRRQLGAS